MTLHAAACIKYPLVKADAVGEEIGSDVKKKKKKYVAMKSARWMVRYKRTSPHRSAENSSASILIVLYISRKMIERQSA